MKMGRPRQQNFFRGRKRDRDKDCEVFIFGTSLEGTGRLETPRQVQRRQGTRPDSQWQLPQVQWKKHPETSPDGSNMCPSRKCTNLLWDTIWN